MAPKAYTLPKSREEPRKPDIQTGSIFRKRPCLSLWERWHGVSRDGEGVREDIGYKPIPDAIISSIKRYFNCFCICKPIFLALCGLQYARGGDGMDEKDFSLRLMRLRELKGVSARDMSLSIGQNPGYINNIELGKSMPSLSGLFYICDYLGVTPSEFFDVENRSPSKLNEVVRELRHLDDRQLDTISAVIKEMVK